MGITVMTKEKGALFAQLHERQDAFIIPNPYDAGTAKLLKHIGFEALATTSAGYAFTVGKQDNQIEREEMLAHAKAIVEATDLPVSADLENGFYDSPDEVARTIEQASMVGLVGGSIEDSTNDGREEKQYDSLFAKERIQAAVEAARNAPFRFTLTARAENYLVGNPDIADVIGRLQNYEEAGADVLFAPGITKVEDLKSVIANTSKPLNVVMGLSGVQLSQQDLSELGVKRISAGSSLSRAALGAFIRAGKEMLNSGSFSYAEDAVPYGDVNGVFG